MTDENAIPAEGTPQGATRRWPWSKAKVQTKPTRKNRRDYKKLARQTRLPE